jgi:glycosyltransferase involved in cell wall biosynthesis
MDKTVNQKDTIVIIPAHNEEESIALVLNHIPKERIHKIIVVNNASTDKTSEVAAANGAVVLNESRKGYGRACLTGLDLALAEDPAYIAFLDGDFSDKPQELTLLLEKLDDGFDFVLGSRTLGKAEKHALLPQAIFGNWLATSLMRLLYGGYFFSDLGPFRAIRTDKLRALNMCDTNFGWTMEMQAKALLHNLRCCEISVSYKKRIGVSKITGTISGTFMAGYKILYTLFKLWIVSKFSRKKEIKLQA